MRIVCICWLKLQKFLWRFVTEARARK